MALYDDTIPPPTRLTEKLLGIPPGFSVVVTLAEGKPSTVRSTLTRLSSRERQFRTKAEGDGVRVWRLEA